MMHGQQLLQLERQNKQPGWIVAQQQYATDGKDVCCRAENIQLNEAMKQLFMTAQSNLNGMNNPYRSCKLNDYISDIYDKYR